MKTNVNTLKWLFGLFLILLTTTYLISLNIENQFVKFDSKWVSNNFLFVVAGGALASLIIVIIAELIKYFQLKTGMENFLFSQFANLYGQVLIIRSTCKRALNGYQEISDNMIQPIVNNAMSSLDAIYYSDYSPIRKKNAIKELHSHFKQDKYQIIKSIFTESLYLNIAIATDKANLMRLQKPEIVTFTSPNTNDMLNKLVSQTSTLLTLIDNNLIMIDKALGNKYKWQEIKVVLNAYQDNFTIKGLGQYLSEDIQIL